MFKRIFQITLGVCIAAVIAFSAIILVKANKNKAAFLENGYVLVGDQTEEESKQIYFDKDSEYNTTMSGLLKFKDSAGNSKTITDKSFVMYDDGSLSATDDGVLLDFDDLTDNFINNYSISKGLLIKSDANGYSADTSNGRMTFGENLFKLSDSKYIINSPKLKVHFSDEDEREVEDFVQISEGQDGIINILTKDNLWMTISENCYIETENGVRVYPVSKIIDSRNYKLSLTSLAVNPDDNIVLTMAQQRRQIIPKINVDTQDGRDGVDGDTGIAGDDGEKGTTGTQGADGLKGEEGEAGGSGSAGRNGNTGDIGSTGISSTAESTSYSSVPTMSFQEWNITPNSLCGSIIVKDKSNMLIPMSGDKNHPAKVTIIDLTTGGEIPCYETDSAYKTDKIDPEITDFTGFYNGDGSVVYFTTLNGPLNPNSEYSISVQGYYSSSDTVFHREFITRDFYTDSMGVFMVEDGSSVDSVSIISKTSEEYLPKINKVTVYLLNTDQAKKEIPDDDYTDKREIYFNEGKIQRIVDDSGREYEITDEMRNNPSSIPITFSGLSSDHPYITRIRVVNGESGLDLLTKQKLELRTLKKLIIWEQDSAPQAAYNRVTGAVEVFLPNIADGSKDSVVSYICTPYTMDPAFPDDMSKAKAGSPRELLYGESEPINFYLESGNKYYFKVTAKCNDNEKTVYYDCQNPSNIVEVRGTKMPGIKLTSDDGFPKPNAEQGTITITLDENSDLKVDELRNLKLDIYADQIYVDSISINAADIYCPASTEDFKNYLKAKYRVSNEVSNDRYIDLDFSFLHQLTDYTVNLTGYTKLGGDYDDTSSGQQGYVKRSLGTVRFQTPVHEQLSASMVRNPQSSYNMEIKLNMALADPEGDSYSINELTDGQMVLSLYKGSTTDGTPIAEKTVNKVNFSEEDMEALITDKGLTITNQTFGVTLDVDSTYTLSISDVKDRTYTVENLYTNGANTYTVQNSAVLITPTLQPYDLLSDPTKGITADPIYCREVKKYDASYDTTGLDGNAIVGYRLTANYKNLSRLAESVTYYLLEYNQFFSAIMNHKDPIMKDVAARKRNESAQIMAITRNVVNNEIPKIAVLFGGEKGALVSETTVDGFYVYRGGEPILDGDKLTGMGRGYRYLFAYTMDYKLETGSVQTLLYPYDFIGQYETYKEKYGAGSENGVSLGVGDVYILNSGMKEAPKQDPLFSGYVANSSLEITHDTNNPAKGYVNWNYIYRDIDSSIPNNSKFICEWAPGIEQNTLAPQNEWGTASFPVTVYINGTVINPKIPIYKYADDYTDVLRYINRSSEAELERSPEVLLEIPVDYYWKNTFESPEGLGNLSLDIDTSRMSENRIDLKFGDLADSIVQTIYSRTLGVRITAKAESGDKITICSNLEKNGKKYVIPVYTDALASLRGKGKISFEAFLVYDNGLIGWDYADNNNTTSKGFGIQYQNNSGYISTANGEYFVGENQTNEYPTGGLLLKKDGVINSLRSKAFDIGKYHPLFNYELTTSNPMTWYLYPTRYGVDINGESNASRLSGRYAVAKCAAEKPVSVVGEAVNIDKITPSVNNFEGTGKKYSVSATKFKLNGFDSEKGKIYFAVYDRLDSARALSSDEHRLGDPVKLDPSSLQDGSFPITEGQTIDLPGGSVKLEENTLYYIAMYIIYNDDPDNKVPLIDGTTRDKAVYELSTVGDVVIEQELNQVNTTGSYFNKYSEITYKTNRFLGVKIKYNIFDTYEHALVEKEGEEFKEESWDGLVLSSEKMGEATVHDLSSNDPENTMMSMISVPAVSKSGNTIRFWMEPTELRGKLVPGQEYYVRCSAYEEGMYVGGGVIPLKIPDVNQKGYITRITEVNQNSVEFAVTINDKSRVYMGSLKDNHTAAGSHYQGLYTVRFVYQDDDGIERHIPTVYDEYVFSEDRNTQQSFILSENTIIKERYSKETPLPIVPGRAYTMRIYAASDENQDGKTNPVGVSAEGVITYTSKDLFDTLQDGNLVIDGKAIECKQAVNFTNYIDSYWKKDTFERTAAASYESGFLIGQKTQKTLTGDYNMPDPEMDTDKYFFEPISLKSFGFELNDAYGLIRNPASSEPDHIFKKIFWQIQNTTTAAVCTGTSLYSDSTPPGELLLKEETDSLGNTIYSYIGTIDGQENYMVNGVTYLLTIEFYENESDSNPKYRYSGSIRPKHLE